MSNESTEFDVDIERLVDLAINLADHIPRFKQAIVGDGGDEDVVELAEELWEVLDEGGELLETIDFEELPDAIDLEDLPETVDVGDVPEGLFTEDESAIELSNLREAVNLRELWDAVDLTDLYQEKKELEDEVDDVTDRMEDEEEDGMVDKAREMMGDDEDDELFEAVVEFGEGANVEFNAEARQAVVEEKIQEAVEKFRKMLLTTHEKLRKLYEMN